MYVSAVRTCEASSRVMRRTSTFVSTACMLLPKMRSDGRFHFLDRVRLGRGFENGAMNIFERVFPNLANDESSVVCLPLQNRSRTNSKRATDLSGNGDLTLRGNLRLRKCHGDIVPR